MLSKIFGLLAAVTAGAMAACTSCTSCANSTSTCQVNRPGGLLLLTTFWDTNPSNGPSDSFTIHGQWPDNCSGGYQSSCDSSRAYTNIVSICNNYGRSDLADYINTYWLDQNGANTLVDHEWAKHGTCISTLNPSCYSGYQKYDDLFSFLDTTVDLHQNYDIYGALTNAGIYPSSTKSYSLSSFQAATRSAFGQNVTFRCSSGALNEVWIYFHTTGRSTSVSAFSQVAPLSGDTNCPSTLKWLPK